MTKINGNGLTRAMIMAAGLGTRMMPLTADKPKPLIAVQGKTLIDHAIDRLIEAGMKMIVVNVHYKAELLIAHLEKRKDMEIRISDESGAVLDTGGGITKALALFDGEPFFTLNSDSLWVEGMSRAILRMRACWDREKMDALMLVAPCATAIGYDGLGDFEMSQDGLLRRRTELKLAPFVWTGLQILHPRLFDGAPKGRFSINPLWDKAIAKKRLYGVRLDGVWLHVGTPQGVEDAEAFLRDLELTP